MTRAGIDKLKDAGRDEAPFELIVERDGDERRYLARAVIDASGTWTRPNPLGAGGLPAAGERAHADRIAYGIPDVLGRRPRPLRGQARARRRQRPLRLQRDPRPRRAARAEPATEIVWAIRGGAPGRKLRRRRGRPAARRAARSARPSARLLDDGSVELVAGLPDARASRRDGERLVLADGERARRRRGHRRDRASGPTSSCCASCGSTSTTASRRRARLRR